MTWADGKEELKRLSSWLRTLSGWLSEKPPRHLFFAVIVIGGALVAALAFPSERTVRLTGLVWQLIGIVIVVCDIQGKSKRYDFPGLWQSFREWLRRRPAYGSGSVHRWVGAASGSVSLRGGRASLRVGLPPGASVEQRVRLLEQSLESQSDKLDSLQDQVDQNRIAQDGALQSEHQVRKAAIETLNEALKATQTDGLHISMIGTGCVLMGSILSTASIEIFSWCFAR